MAADFTKGGELTVNVFRITGQDDPQEELSSSEDGTDENADVEDEDEDEKEDTDGDDTE